MGFFKASGSPWSIISDSHSRVLAPRTPQTCLWFCRYPQIQLHVISRRIKIQRQTQSHLLPLSVPSHLAMLALGPSPLSPALAPQPHVTRSSPARSARFARPRPRPRQLQGALGAALAACVARRAEAAKKVGSERSPSEAAQPQLEGGGSESEALSNRIRAFFGSIYSLISLPFGGLGNFVRVEQGSVGVVLRFGRLQRVLPPGRHAFNVAVEQVVVVPLSLGSMLVRVTGVSQNLGLNSPRPGRSLALT